MNVKSNLHHFNVYTEEDVADAAADFLPLFLVCKCGSVRREASTTETAPCFNIMYYYYSRNTDYSYYPWEKEIRCLMKGTRDQLHTEGTKYSLHLRYTQCFHHHKSKAM